MANTTPTFSVNQFISNLGKTTYVIQALILCFISGLLLEIFKQPVFSILFFASGFSVFDAIGFNLASAIVPSDTTNIAKYRITQVMVQIFMLMIVFDTVGLLSVLGCMIVWWLTTCDKLYYIILKTPQQSTDTYPWLENWSIFYILKNVFKIKADVKSFNTMAILGILFGIAISYL